LSIYPLYKWFIVTNTWWSKHFVSTRVPKSAPGGAVTTIRSSYLICQKNKETTLVIPYLSLLQMCK